MRIAHNKGMLHVPDSRYLATLKSRTKVSESGCWEWTRFTVKSWGNKSDGYGHMSYRGKDWPAHRLSYLLHFGVHPGKLDVMHKCDNPKCVNPDHLELGTRKQNIRDAIKRRRSHVAQLNKEKTHCPKGHSFAEHGVHIANKGGWVQRSCRVCQRIRTRIRAGWPEALLNLPPQKLGQRPAFVPQREVAK
jgi:hypothetical protein